MEKKLRFNSATIHGGQAPDPAFGAVMPPIYQTSTYAQSTPGGHKGFEYSRTHNPTRSALEKSLASIENGKHGLAFASGLAAMDAIMKLLPHRYPFLLVDRILEIEQGSYAIGVKNVTINDNFFPGHFPQRPIMPGVLMVEAMAQVGGLIMLEGGGEGMI